MRVVKAAAVQMSPVLYSREGNGRKGRAEDPRTWPTGSAVRHVPGDRGPLLPVLFLRAARLCRSSPDPSSGSCSTRR